METKPLILYHIEDPAKSQKLIDLCRPLHFGTKPLTNADAGKTIGVLAGIPGAVQKAGKVPAGYKLPELLVFHNLSSEALDFFLAAYRKAGIAPVALKAIVTPHNQSWPLYVLTEELQKERAAMLLMQQNKSKN